VSVYEAITFKRSNQKTVIHQIPKVSVGQKVEAGTVLIEGPSVCDGEVALGKNLRVAFMPRDGYNYEDAIIISQRLVKEDALTSIHIDEYEIEVSDTKLGAEETTNDIPGVSLNKLKNLDDDGIIRLGAVVK
jgi:DNA-directed RNA polymerase subunit beta